MNLIFRKKNITYLKVTSIIELKSYHFLNKHLTTHSASKPLEMWYILVFRYCTQHSCINSIDIFIGVNYPR